MNPEPEPDLAAGVTLTHDPRGYTAICRMCGRHAPAAPTPTTALDVWEAHIRHRCEGISPRQRQLLGGG